MERGSIYPSWRYHPDGRAELCLGKDRDDEMGAEWSDEDVRFTKINAGEPSPAPEPEPEPSSDEVEPPRRGRPRKVVEH
jgi:hypothetical protein